jgi:hypothetical protein
MEPQFFQKYNIIRPKQTKKGTIVKKKTKLIILNVQPPHQELLWRPTKKAVQVRT